ncbi:terminase large subunit [Shigella phage vB_SsoS_008]|nr:terminase large subunit [Shigella phage vB_SsoS_008]
MIHASDLDATQKEAIKKMSEANFEKMIRIWFQLMQAQQFQLNWHHLYLCHLPEEIIAKITVPTSRQVRVKPRCSVSVNRNHASSPSSSINSKTCLRNAGLQEGTKPSRFICRQINKAQQYASSWDYQQQRVPRVVALQVRQKLIERCSHASSFDNEDGKVWFELISAAAGGRITGSRGGYMMPGFSGMVMLDDIDKPDDMFSKVKRERTHMLLKNTIRSRRMHNETPIIAIQQRLHAQDSTWFMMNGGMGIEFDLSARIPSSIPALVTEEYGKTLPDWPDPYFERGLLSFRYVELDGVGSYSYRRSSSKERNHDLLALREADQYTLNIGALKLRKATRFSVPAEADRTWRLRVKLGMVDLLRQQSRRGRARSGQIFLPFHHCRYRSVDRWTKRLRQTCLWGKKNDKVYFIDGIRGKWEAPDMEKQFTAFVNQAWRHNKSMGVLRKIYVEDKASGTGLIQNLRKKTPISITPLQRNKDKVSGIPRAMDAQPVIKAGRVVLPEEHPMLAEIIAEHSAFTYDDTHPHDDIVDNFMDAANIELLTISDPIERMKRLAGMVKR